jgi:pimeloyl-ACP methyl ester carboxylesterase
MPRVSRPDGVDLHWEEHGSGPTVVLGQQCISYPEVYLPLRNELAADHRVITYHLRGCGLSTRSGPYDPPTDAGDLLAVIEAAGSPPAVGVGMGDAAFRLARIGATRPDLISHVVVPVGYTVGAEATRGTDALTSSPAVLRALSQQLETDYRGALHSMIAAPNPQLDAEAVRARIDRTVDHVPQEVAVARMHWWVREDATAESRELGERLWILSMPENPWFTPEIGERLRTLLPEAHIEEVENGPISRPDITTGIVRGLTRGQTGALSSDSQR